MQKNVFDPCEAICMQNPTVMSTESWHPFHLISSGFIKTVLDNLTSAHHCSRCVRGRGIETGWGITSSLSTQQLRVHGLYFLLEWLHEAGEVDDVKMYNPHPTGGSLPPQSVKCSLCIMDALHSEMPCSLHRLNKGTTTAWRQVVCVRVCECQSKEDVWCQDGVLQNCTSVCVWMVLHRRAEWKENETLCGVKSRKYLKRRKMKKKKKAAIVLKTSQSTRDQPGGRKQYVTFREEEKKGPF